MRRLLLICAMAALVSACDKKDDYGAQVSGETIDQFNTRFPDAKGVNWESRGIYRVAVFRSGGDRLTAWYQQNGNWCMTEKRLDESGAPIQVMNAYKTDARSNSTVSYVDQLTREGIEDIFVVVADETGALCEYYYSADGVPVKAIDASGRVYDDYRNEIVPQVPDKVYTKVRELYPAARIMEVDVIFPGVLYVDIVDNRILKSMEFSLTGSWSMTSWAVSEQYVKTNAPEVYAAYRELGYNETSCTIESIDCIQTASVLYYWLHIDNNGTPGNVKITGDGHVITVS